MFLLFSHPSRTRWCDSNEIPDKIAAVECLEFDKSHHVPDVEVRRSTTTGEAGFCLLNITSQMLIHTPGSYTILQNWIEDRENRPRQLQFVCQYNYYDRLASRDDKVLERLADEVSEIQKSLRGFVNAIGEEMITAERSLLDGYDRNESYDSYEVSYEDSYGRNESYEENSYEDSYGDTYDDTRLEPLVGSFF